MSDRTESLDEHGSWRPTGRAYSDSTRSTPSSRGSSAEILDKQQSMSPVHVDEEEEISLTTNGEVKVDLLEQSNLSDNNGPFQVAFDEDSDVSSDEQSSEDDDDLELEERCIQAIRSSRSLHSPAQSTDSPKLLAVLPALEHLQHARGVNLYSPLPRRHFKPPITASQHQPLRPLYDHTTSSQYSMYNPYPPQAHWYIPSNPHPLWHSQYYPPHLAPPTVHHMGSQDNWRLNPQYQQQSHAIGIPTQGVQAGKVDESGQHIIEDRAPPGVVSDDEVVPSTMCEFHQLNQHLMHHIHQEISSLEAKLQAFDFSPHPNIKSAWSEQHRSELMDRIFTKLAHYHRVLEWQSTGKDTTAVSTTHHEASQEHKNELEVINFVTQEHRQHQVVVTKEQISKTLPSQPTSHTITPPSEHSFVFLMSIFVLGVFGVSVIAPDMVQSFCIAGLFTLIVHLVEGF